MIMDLKDWSGRRELLIRLQKELKKKYPEEDYNIFVFGSYIRKDFEYGKSDIDLVLYCPDFKKRDKIASFLEAFFKEFLPCDILQYFYSPNATIFYPAITGGMPLTDYYPDELVGELYYLRRYYSKEQAEKKDYARHLRWYEIFLKAGMLNQEGGETVG